MPASRLLRLALLVGIGGLVPPAWADMGMGPEPLQYFVSADRLEAQFRDGTDARLWDLEAWVGRDLNKFWFKSEGEDTDDGLEQAEVQGLFSRAVSAFWDLQLGLRHDLRPNPTRSYAVLGMQGEAPYRIEVDAAAFISENGDASLRIETEYDLRLTQRWILQPRTEFEFAFSQDSDLGVGRGPNSLEAGLRLRYAVVPEFAPYIGLDFETALGDTRNLRRNAGEERSSWGAVLGIHAWF